MLTRAGSHRDKVEPRDVRAGEGLIDPVAFLGALWGRELADNLASMRRSDKKVSVYSHF